MLFLNTTTGHTISHRVNNSDVMVMTAERLNPAGSTQIDLGDYNRKWRTLYAAELYVEVLVAQSVMATIGGRIMVAPTTKLIADINGYQMYIDVKDNDLFNGDYLRLETAPGGVPQVEEMRVVSTPTTITGGFRYNVLRRVNDTTGIVTIASMNSSQTTIDVNAGFIGNPTYFYLNIAGSPLSEVIQVNSAPTTIVGGYRYNCVRNVTGTGAQTWASGAKAVFTYLSWLSGDAVVSLAGGSASITTLVAALTNVATTMDVGSSGLVNGVNYFLQKSTQYEVVTVTSAATAVTGGYRYTVTRNVNGGGAKSWALADSIMDTRQQTGRGYIDLTSTSTVHNHLGPTIAIYSRTGTTNWNDVKAVVSFGNLRSFVDYTADTFGWAVGNDLTLSPTGGFSGMTGDATNGLRLFNLEQRMYSGGAEFSRMDVTHGYSLMAYAGSSATPPINGVTWYRDSITGNKTGNVAGVYYTAFGTSTNGNRMSITANDSPAGASQVYAYAFGETGGEDASVIVKAGKSSLGLTSVVQITAQVLSLAGNFSAFGSAYLGNISTPGTPSGGGYLYCNAGRLFFKGSSGNITQLAIA